MQLNMTISATILFAIKYDYHRMNAKLRIENFIGSLTLTNDSIKETT